MHHENIQNWNARSLSRAGKEVLLKLISQSILAYCMTFFLLPTSFGEEIECMIYSFY
jgi:hypothetical protein